MTNASNDEASATIESAATATNDSVLSKIIAKEACKTILNCQSLHQNHATIVTPMHCIKRKNKQEKSL